MLCGAEATGHDAVTPLKNGLAVRHDKTQHKTVDIRKSCASHGQVVLRLDHSLEAGNMYVAGSNLQAQRSLVQKAYVIEIYRVIDL